jgi:hypothetical protein
VFNRFSSYLRRHHLALLALFVALGGSAYAAGQIKSSDIKNSAIVSKDIKNNTIKGADVNEASLAVSRVVARPRSTGPLVLPPPPAPPDFGVDYPLTDATWTQAADETDQILGTATVDVPGACNGISFATVAVLINGKPVAVSSLPLFQTGELKLPVNGGFVGQAAGDLSDPGDPTDRTMTVQASGSCAPGPGAITLKDLKVTVVGNR